jgi:hypothetical protein
MLCVGFQVDALAAAFSISGETGTRGINTAFISRTGIVADTAML